MSELVIRIEGLGKRYRLFARPSDKIHAALGVERLVFWRKLAAQDFWALRDLSLQVVRGERVGIIGHNGAGKSTLLKLIARVIRPTSGRVWVQGQVAPLLSIGAGFDTELSGRENVFLNGALLGRSIEEIEAVLADGSCAQEVLAYFAPRAAREEKLAERIAFHASVPRTALVVLASKGNSSVVELVLTNQERLLRQPEVLELLMVNPALRPDQRGRILELLERAGFSGHRHRLQFHRLLSTPILFVAMILIAATFSLRPQRRGRVGLLILSGIVTGFLLHLISNFVFALGLSNRLPVELAGWTPAGVSLMLGVALLLHLEDG